MTPYPLRPAPFQRPVLFAQLLMALLLFGGAILASAQNSLVVPINQTWKFEQSNIDLGTTWRDVGFNASGPGWGTGTGPLGFNGLTLNEALPDGLALITLLNRTTNAVQPRTYYFRTTFNFTNSPTGVTLIASNLIDDAAVFFLNGVEIGRAGFNVGTVVTFATGGDRGAADVTAYGWDVFTNTAASLVQGVNTFAVEVHQTGGNSSDLVFGSRLLAIIPTPLAITQQPTNATATENRVLNLTLGVSGSAPQVQWYKGTNPAVAVPAATNATFTIANTAIADTGDYFAIAMNFLNAVTSQVARVTISNDTNGPVLLSVRGDETFQKIILTWDETLETGPVVELSNYIIYDSLSNVLTINSAQQIGNVVVLHVPALNINSLYSVELDNQRDLVGNPTLPVGEPIGDANGVVVTLRTWLIVPGFTRFQAYLNLPANQTLGQFTAMPIYPNAPTFGFLTNQVNWPQTAPLPNGLDQYAMRFAGLFVAPENGLHRFNPSHDDEMRLRIYPGPDNTGLPSELAAACCTGLLDGPSLDVTLVAGQRYYYELIVREFGGGDYAGLSVILPSDVTNSPISQQSLAIAFEPAFIADAGFAVQPQNQATTENHAATFSALVTNAVNGLAYQWQLDNGGGFADIAGATASSHTTPLRTLANHGNQYRVLANTPGLVLTSAVAVLTVTLDNVAPEVVTARGTRSLSTVRVTFNEAMAAGSANTPGNYTLTSNGVPLAISSATLGGDLMTVTLQTDAQAAGTVFNLNIQNVTDAAGNPLVATNVAFQTWIYSRGFVLKELYQGLSGGVAINDLRTAPIYPNSPTLVRYGNTAELNTADEFDNYGARLSGTLTPAATGNHTFYLAGDDNSELWLSTDVNPVNIATLGMIAREPVWSGRRTWIGEAGGGGRVGATNASLGPQANITGPISLAAGQQYYFEALVKEGGGGDNLAISWRTPGGPVPVNGNLPVGGFILAALADPVGAVINVTQQPASTNLQPGQTASFAVRATGTNVNGAAPFAWQWQRFISGSWTDLSGATSSNYTTGVLLAGDNGAQYRALVFIPGTSTVSAVATVSIGLPRLSIRTVPPNAVLSWSSSFTGFTLESSPVLPAVGWTSQGPIVLINAENTITVPLNSSNTFFRLRK